MEYIILWVFALFGLWSLISNIIESFYISNMEGGFEIILNICNQEDTVEILINQLSRIDMVGKIKVFDNNSTDNTMEIIKKIQKSNPRVIICEDT